MSTDVYERLRTAGNDEGSAVYLEQPISPAEWEACLQRGRAELGWEGLEWYRDFLETSNGVQIDNAIFESAEGLIEANLDYRASTQAQPRFVLFGNSGNLDAYLLDREATYGPFLVANFYGDFSRDEEILERYPSLEALLTTLLDREAGVV